MATAQKRARSNVGEVRLLALTQGLELVKGTSQKGYRLRLYPLYPPEDPGSRRAEIYFLLHGSLRTLRNLTRTPAEKDAGETEEHCRRMRTLSHAVGKKLGLSQHIRRRPRVRAGRL